MTRFPTKLNDFFDNFRQAFLFDHFHYFQLLVFAFTISYGRRNVTNVYRHVETKKPRNRVNNFFLVSHRFDLPNLLRQKAYDLVKRLDPKPGETIDLILDDSKKAKRGKSMAAVGWLFDPATKKSVQGQNYLVAILRFRGFLIPFAAEIYVKKEHVKDLRLKHRKLALIRFLWWHTTYCVTPLHRKTRSEHSGRASAFEIDCSLCSNRSTAVSSS